MGAAVVFGINGYVVHFGEKYILSPMDSLMLSDMDCIVVKIQLSFAGPLVSDEYLAAASVRGMGCI